MRTAPFPLTLRQLQYVVAVAEARSFRRAAEACHVSQPSLSAQLAEAERGLGVRLFERDRRRVLLSPAGEALLARARAVLVAADDLVEAARLLADPLAGTLRLGVIPTVGPYLLPAVAPALRAAFPRLQLVWTEDKTGQLVRRISAGELDGALVAREADLGDLAHEPFAADRFVLAAPADHPLARGAGPVAAEALAGERVLLLDEGHCLREQALAFCARARAEELGYRATSLSTLVQMVASGAGVTLLPGIAVEHETRRTPLRIRELGPGAARTLVLAFRRGSAVAPALRQVAAALREALAQPAGRAVPDAPLTPSLSPRAAGGEGGPRRRRRRR
jgi:LysR family hydrogen peroxide-inducible transcriptional activator